jgi:hypothetical protein
MPKAAPDYEGIHAWAKAEAARRAGKRTMPGYHGEADSGEDSHSERGIPEMAQPIRPEDITAAKMAALPGEVIDVFNALISAAWDGRSATVMQDDAADAVAGRLGISREEVFERHLLDVEPAYLAAGWNVIYDKPGFNERYKAHFIFWRP